ncbi:MAG: copper-binding protein [Dehalococcoidia bacterium]|nr:copper-binding protein [Dehalococcoidia bacterium]
MTRTELDVPDVSCDHCERAITQALGPQPGVASVHVDIAGKHVTIDHDESLITLARIEELLDDEGYPVRTAASLAG